MIQVFEFPNLGISMDDDVYVLDKSKAHIYKDTQGHVIDTTVDHALVQWFFGKEWIKKDKLRLYYRPLV